MRRLSLISLVLFTAVILSGCPPPPPPLPSKAPTPVPPTPPRPQVTPPQTQPPLPPGRPALPPPDRAQVTPVSTGDNEGKTPEQAAQSACMGHLKVLALAALMYAQDYNERLPASARWSPTLRPYMRNADDLKCPAAPSLPVGYAYDRRLLAKPFDDIGYPQQTLMLGDSALGGANPCCDLTAGSLAPRHRSAGNAAFADGHVKWMGKP